MSFLKKLARVVFNIDPRIAFSTGNVEFDSLFELEALQENLPCYSFSKTGYYRSRSSQFLLDDEFKTDYLYFLEYQNIYDAILDKSKNFFQRDAINISRALAYKYFRMKHTVYFLSVFSDFWDKFRKYPYVSYKYALPRSFHKNSDGNYEYWVVSINLCCLNVFDNRFHSDHILLTDKNFYFSLSLIEVQPELERTLDFKAMKLGFGNAADFVKGIIKERHLFHLQGRYFEKEKTDSFYPICKEEEQFIRNCSNNGLSQEIRYELCND